MATSVIASYLQNALLTFSFHSCNNYGNDCYSLKVIIVITKILATIPTMPGYSWPACQSWCIIALASYS